MIFLIFFYVFLWFFNDGKMIYDFFMFFLMFFLCFFLCFFVCLQVFVVF